MTKRIMVLLAVFLMLFISVAVSGDLSNKKIVPQNLPLIKGDEPMPDARYFPSRPGMALAIGDTAGITQYDYQTNGSTGNRIVVDHQSNIHVSWMKGDPYPSVRHVYYNCKTPAGWIFPGSGTQADQYSTGAGYTTLDVTLDDRATIFYHRAPAGGESTQVAIDVANCLGTFEYYHPPSRSGSQGFIWPYGTVDRNGRIHVVATHNAATGAAQPFMYTRSTNGGTTWVALQRVDTTEVISAILTSSKVSDKVAIVYCHSTDSAYQTKNDIYYILSSDGLTWDWRNGKTNITQYAQDNDSLFAYTDVDAVFDYNDNLQIVWNAQYVDDATGGIYYLDSRLEHFNRTTGVITDIILFPDTLFPTACDMGGWNFTFAKMSVATDIFSNLYVTYTSWDSTDCSAGGYANGDIYAHWSTSGGATWSPQTNLTNSQTPLCEPGDCESDHWSSMAELVDTAIHLFYVNDRDAGGVPQTEGEVTDNPMMYYSFSNFPPILGVDDEGTVPRNFTLAQNYPNPFNAQTNIVFELNEKSHVELVVFDITGARVATLANGTFAAGKHQINWDADQVSSGVYYYTLRANGSEATMKMTLLK